MTGCPFPGHGPATAPHHGAHDDVRRAACGLILAAIDDLAGDQIMARFGRIERGMWISETLGELVPEGTCEDCLRMLLVVTARVAVGVWAGRTDTAGVGVLRDVVWALSAADEGTLT